MSEDGGKKRLMTRRVVPIVVALAIGAVVGTVIALPGAPSRLLADPIPSDGPMTIGVEYRYTLYTHCGLDRDVRFDGSDWDHAGPGRPDDGSDNPPPGFGNPFDHGTLRLLSQDVAEYRSWEGIVARYQRRERPKPSEGCD